MKYCPECGDEFRPDFDQCLNCNKQLITSQSQQDVDPVQVREQNRKKLEISPDDELVTVRRGKLLEVKDIQRLLRENSIGSLLVEDQSDCSGGCCNSKVFELKVKNEHIDEVQTIIMDDFKRSTALDSHDFQEDIGAVFDERLNEANCPACGCSFVTRSKKCPECGLCF